MSSKTKTTATKEEATHALVPKLRFPGFQDADHWQMKLLGGLCKIRTGKKDANEGASDGLYPFFTCAENHIFSHTYSFDSEAILIAGNANVGQTRYYCGKFEAYQRTYVLTDFSGISVPFLYAVLNAKLRDSLLSHVQVSAMSYIKLPMLQEYALAVPPSPAEQQKIAECLSSVDELIAAQARKLESLKTHKKGLMKQLFPREGETQPRLRFPDFQNAGEWEETRLGRLGELVSGLTYRPDDVRESGLLVLRSSNVQQGKIALDDCVYVDPSIKGVNLSQPNDILICVRNGSKALIGKCALIPEGMPLCTHGAFMTVFRAKTPSFVFQLFQSDRYQMQVDGDLGATINSINGGQLLKYEFFVPKPLEQQRIADCLSNLDGLITAETQKLQAIKTHKKGLMQKLFPSQEEIES
jgi:type I restriction enzyme S subunit